MDADTVRANATMLFTLAYPGGSVCWRLYVDEPDDVYMFEGFVPNKGWSTSIMKDNVERWKVPAHPGDPSVTETILNADLRVEDGL